MGFFVSVFFGLSLKRLIRDESTLENKLLYAALSVLKAVSNVIGEFSHSTDRTFICNVNGSDKGWDIFYKIR